MIARLAILAALWSPLVVSSCCTPTVVRSPVVIQAPPCLDTLPPVPPTTEDDGLWSRYHAAMEAWAAYVVGACGAHLIEPDDEHGASPSLGVYGD